jgi:phenylalanyl-tRNA synthetase beta chain
MFISLKWLKELVHIPKAITPEELGLRLTLHTVEIDNVIHQAKRFENIVVAKIKEIKKHPQADRLQIATVIFGKESLEVVCGAQNIKAGDLVPLALAGAKFPNGMEIKETEIRGVVSKGMLCAEDELGLGEDHSGIMILKNGKPGQNFGDYLKMNDILYEVDNKSITHRPDLWSHMGIAREISAFLGTKMTLLADRIPRNNIEAPQDCKLKLSVKIENPGSALRYAAVAMNNITVGESPEWLKERLIAVGQKPINNIVDITNYVMFEIGQPLHAFDLERIAPAGESNSQIGIVVRNAKNGEMLKTLDGNERELDPLTLVIADNIAPQAIAGIIGGENSSIRTETKAIVVESANFEPIALRKTSQRLGVRTESSMRFEKSPDTSQCRIALARAIELIKAVCPESKIASNIEDIRTEEALERSVDLPLSLIRARIGAEIGGREIRSILERLGFKITRTEDLLSVIVPAWRAKKDISIAEDIIEEIARIYGYNHLSPAMPSGKLKMAEKNPRISFKRSVRTALAIGAGLSETYNYSFVGEEQLKRLKIDHSTYLRIANPISSQLTLLKQSLAPNLFENIKRNQARGESMGFFEIGSIYLSSQGEEPTDALRRDFLPFQEERLGIALSGSNPGKAFEEIKDVIAYLAGYFKSEAVFEKTEIVEPWSDRRFSARVNFSGVDVGLVSLLDESSARALGLKQSVAIAEFGVKKLEEAISEPKLIFREFEKFPLVSRDLAFVIDEKITYLDFCNSIKNFSDLIEKAELFDIYSGGKLGQGLKSLAFHLCWRSSERTLKGEEIDSLEIELKKMLNEKFGANIRDF